MKKEIADILLFNGTVWTVNSAQPWAEAVAIRGEKVLEVGSSKELKKMIGSNTQCIDLKGALVLPGFIDSHTHFLNGGFALSSIQLRDVTNRKEFIARIAEKAKNLGQGEWILNGDWDQQKFDIAVTGSLNQKGEIQPIGGVNEKIEGFFKVCKAKGLTGIQGVIIPHQNIQNLMLKKNVIKAVEQGKFHIYPVKTIDEGIEILTGTEAGKRKKDGIFEEGTVNYLVDEELQRLAKSWKTFTSSREKDQE